METKEIFALCYYTYSNWIENESVIAVSESRDLLEEYAKTRTNDTYAGTEEFRNKLVDAGTSHSFIISGIPFLVEQLLPIQVSHKTGPNIPTNQQQCLTSYIGSSVSQYSGYYCRTRQNTIMRGWTDTVVLVHKKWYLPNKTIKFPRVLKPDNAWYPSVSFTEYLKNLSVYFNQEAI